MIIKSLNDIEMSSDPILLRPLVERQYKPASAQVVNYIDKQVIKNCAVVFSGGQPLPTAEVYIEYKYLNNVGLSFNKSPIFVDKNNSKLNRHLINSYQNMHNLNLLKFHY